MQTASEKLRKWVELVGGQKKAAALVGCDQTAISLYINDKHIPSLEIACAMERATISSGFVAPITPYDWADHAALLRKRKARAARKALR